MQIMVTEKPIISAYVRRGKYFYIIDLYNFLKPKAFCHTFQGIKFFGGKNQDYLKILNCMGTLIVAYLLNGCHKHSCKLSVTVWYRLVLHKFAAGRHVNNSTSLSNNKHKLTTM